MYLVSKQDSGLTYGRDRDYTCNVAQLFHFQVSRQDRLASGCYLVSDAVVLPLVPVANQATLFQQRIGLESNIYIYVSSKIWSFLLVKLWTYSEGKVPIKTYRRQAFLLVNS